MYTSLITVNGKEYNKAHKVWMDAFMHITDVVNVLRSQPSFAKQETIVNAVVRENNSNSIVATYSKYDGWDYR